MVTKRKYQILEESKQRGKKIKKRLNGTKKNLKEIFSESQRLPCLNNNFKAETKSFSDFISR